MLKYIATKSLENKSVNNLFETPRFPVPTGNRRDGLKQLLDKEGPQAVSKWVLDQKKLLITDTTCRDAHQSLLGTRVREIIHLDIVHLTLPTDSFTSRLGSVLT